MDNDKILEIVDGYNNEIQSYEKELSLITFENQQEDVQKANFLMEKIDKVIQELEHLISKIQ
jgi:hypothetical protein